MARTIGVKNKNLVKKLTRIEIENETETYLIEDKIIENLPASLWDIWESADSEIRRIIFDTIMESN